MQNQIIILQLFIFHFIDTPKGILKGWGNILKFNLEFFSVFALLKTLFSPWKRYSWKRGRGFDLWEFIEVLLSNLVSRLIGAIIRIFIIILGIFSEIIIFIIGLVVFIVWLLLPAFLIYGFYYGFKIIF